jgi:hypothetical protein
MPSQRCAGRLDPVLDSHLPTGTFMTRRPRSVFLLIVMLALVGCRGTDSTSADRTGQKPSGQEWFQDVTDHVGLDFVHDAGAKGKFFMPESMGSGAAVFDYDNDGRMDLYLVQNGGPESASPNRLYRQTEDGRFADATATSGLGVKGYGMGVAVGDVNNDGWPDVFLTEYDRGRLFLNEGNGHFLDLTEQAGIENPHWGTSASFFDYDRDGWLDLVVANYVDYAPTQQCFDQKGALEYCGPSGFPPTLSRLFRNLGATSQRQVKFQDVTAQAGLAQHPGPGQGVVCADFDGDRWPDIFLADDAAANRLFINRQDGTFVEEAMLRGIAFNAMGQPQANMGIALGDVDGDQVFDIFVTHLNTETHALWSQEPRGMFQDRSATTGVTRTKWRGTAFGTLFCDFDHDGAIDLAMVNGSIKRTSTLDPSACPHLDPFWVPYAERNQLLSNNGDGTFSDRSTENPTFCGTPAVARGLACADIDGDGAIDLLVTNAGSAARLYRNVSEKRGHWLMVRAIDPALGGRDAYGAEVTVKSGDWRSVRWVNPAYSYMCSNDSRCHFGLGSRSQVDQISVIWPDGSEEVFGSASVDQMVVLKKGAGTKP